MGVLLSPQVEGPLEPLGSYLLVRSASAEEVTKGGLLLPKSQKPKEGEVVAVGPGEANVDSGHVVPVSVELGDKAAWPGAL